MGALKNNPYIPVREQTLKNSPEDSESGKGDAKLRGAAPGTESMAVLGPEAQGHGARGGGELSISGLR